MKSLKKNYIYNLLYQVLAIISPLITTPYISRVLGAEGIGEYSYGLSIATYFAIFGALGMTTYSQIEIAKNRDNLEKTKKLIAEVFVFKTVTLIICCLIYLIVALNSGQHRPILLVLMIYLFSQLNDVSWILQGLENFKELAIRNCFIKILSIICIFIFIKKAEDLYLYTILLQGSIFLGNFLVWPYIWKYINPKSLKQNVEICSFMRHLKNSLVYFIPTIATTVYTVLDKSMIGWITGSDFQNGYYEQAHKIEQILLVLITSLGTVTLPRMSFLNNKNDKKEMNRIMEKTILMVLFLSLPMCIGLIGIADKLIPIFLGEEYIECITITKIFSFLIVIVGLDNIIGRQCLMATNNQKKFNIGVIVGAIVNIIMNLILIPYTGAIGAAISSVCAELIILILFIIFGKKYLKINISKSFIKYIIATLLMFIVISVENSISQNMILCMIIQIVSGIGIYFLVLLILREHFLIEVIDNLKDRFLHVFEKK